MKKWLKWLILPACLFWVSPVWGQSLAHDTSKGMSYYSTYGWSAGAVVKHAIDRSAMPESLMQHVFDNSSTVRNQLERRVMTIPLTTTSADVDTLWDQLFTVPAGQTITVTEMLLSSHEEIDEATDSLHLQVCYYSGTVKATLDTAVASFCIDDDSTIVYADTIYTMTLIDSVFTAGDIVSSWIMAPGGAVSAGGGAAITIEYILDE